jgi:UDP-N-acetylmuramoyl-L-alanyl-D-glutamate--2,6-diaminopimelate ligase
MKLHENGGKSFAQLANYLGLEIAEELAVKTFTGVSIDSREVEVGDLFIALRGENYDGNVFRQEAIKKGAIAVLSDQPSADILVKNIRGSIGPISHWLADFPMRAMQSAAVTGTNGKTTVAQLLHQIWELGGRKTLRIGTLGVKVGNQEIPGKFTTPEPPNFVKALVIGRNVNARNMVMEVSSHALALDRVLGAHFNFAIFTNLTQDHLDFHKDMESYFQAKAKLFTHEYSDESFINIDDPYGRRLAMNCEIPFHTLSRWEKSAQWHYESIVPTAQGFEIQIRGEGGIFLETALPLIGEHNLDNYLAAVAVAITSGIDPLDLAAVTRELKAAPGRLENINLGQNFTALVDYAHTPDAVTRTLATLRKNTMGKIIAVLGCGGDRDPGKRAPMGKAANELSDIAIFTNDNPRSEDPEKILDEMEKGVTNPENIIRIPDRKMAIMKAVALANSGDTVVVLGKGHEVGQIFGQTVLPFDDRETLRFAIEEKLKSTSVMRSADEEKSQEVGEI